MTDREKVIRGLECCVKHDEGFKTSSCFSLNCPYLVDCTFKNYFVKTSLMRDVLELLKEQEPVAHAAWLCKETSTAYDLYGVKTWAAKYKCSKCGFTHRAIEAHMSYGYCPSCGAKMDEEIKESDE